jgi:6-phosphogluconolactonase
VVASVAPSVHRFDDLPAASRGLAERTVALARDALAGHGRFALGLSGGSTPEPLFRLLATEYRRSVPWAEVDFFWVDERAVPPTDPQSNFALASRCWLGPLGIPRDRIHRVHGEGRPLDGVARDYEADLLRLASGPEGPRDPLLDLALLGIGPDGHTASLFPGSPFLEGGTPLVAVVERAGQPPFVPRITMTAAALNRSRVAAFLVAGTEKRAALRRILGGPKAGELLPAARIQGLKGTEWFVDRAASGGSGSGREERWGLK